MRREETYVKVVSYCDLCIEQKGGGEPDPFMQSYGNVCYICKRDVCENHIKFSLPDYANIYKTGSYTTLDICEECSNQEDEMREKIYNLNDMCMDKFREIYNQWRMEAKK